LLGSGEIFLVGIDLEICQTSENDNKEGEENEKENGKATIKHF
jgi:hypothetical protein